MTSEGVPNLGGKARERLADRGGAVRNEGESLIKEQKKRFSRGPGRRPAEANFCEKLIRYGSQRNKRRKREIQKKKGAGWREVAGCVFTRNVGDRKLARVPEKVPTGCGLSNQTCSQPSNLWKNANKLLG